MNNKFSVLIIFSTLLGFNLPVQSHNDSYWTDSSGNMVRSGANECWGSGRWKKSDAAECGGKMSSTRPMSKPKPMMASAMDADGDGVIDSKDQCPDTPRSMTVAANGCPADSDGDGASDLFDKCPDTPPGIEVDATGCPLDTDGDGAADIFDKCPGTPKGIPVDHTGCPADTDGDGAADSYDRCPGTPKGVSVDASGCAIDVDDDNDGISNANDDCPNTARNTAVNTRGCKLEKSSIELDDVQFNTGTAVLSSASLSKLDKVAKTLKDNEHLSFEVAGHTDSSGNYQSNVNLSQARADSVRQYLVEKGIDPSRLTARGYGPDKPIASNSTRQGRGMNRRVELMLK